VAGQGSRPGAETGVAPAVSARSSGVSAPGGTLTGMSRRKSFAPARTSSPPPTPAVTATIRWPRPRRNSSSPG